jgi:hypothetical protein
VPLETVAVVPTEILPVITGSALFVGAADAGEILKVDIESAEIKMTFSVLNPKKLFIPKSFH